KSDMFVRLRLRHYGLNRGARSSQFKKGNISWNLGLNKHNNTLLKKISEKAKQRFLDEEWLNIWSISLNKKPNKPENQINNLLYHLFPNKWRYTGDGKAWIGGKNPDFMDTQCKKCILLHGEYWHYKKLLKENPNITKEIIEQQDKTHYNNLGYGCMIVWENELKHPEQVIHKIKEFSQ
ncbi:MAG: hypothetical protein AABY22_35235, partial [Nanoarchaeota archaeon]